MTVGSSWKQLDAFENDTYRSARFASLFLSSSMKNVFFATFSAGFNILPLKGAI